MAEVPNPNELEHLTDAQLRARRRQLTFTINAIYSIPEMALALLIVGLLLCRH